MVCLNDECETRIDVHTGKSSALDLTLVSKAGAGISEASKGRLSSNQYLQYM